MEHTIGIVVPTLGDRPEYLAQCVRSVRSAGSAVLGIVCSDSAQRSLTMAGVEPDLWIMDPGGGAAAAINSGIASLPEHVTAVGWIGDDDLLEPETLQVLASLLDRASAAVFGACRYVDRDSSELFVNRSGRYAPLLMRLGPNLLPQPGSLIRRSAWDAIGGLDESLKWTFDLDLFIRLGTQGKLVHTNRVVASFRWHSGSLTAGSRQGSVDEASQVRVQHMPRLIRPFARLWEPAVRRTILMAGNRVTQRISQRQESRAE